MERTIKTFTDGKGESWRIGLTIGKIKEVREKVVDREGKAVDLFEYVNGSLAYLLHVDPVIFADILWVLCRDEAEGRRLNKEAFTERLIGDTLEEAESAFVEAFVDFFPKAQQGQVRKIAETAMKFRETLRETQQRAVEEELGKLKPKNSGII